MVSRSRAKERAKVSTKAVPGKDGISSTEIVATAANTATEGVKHFEDFAQVSSIQSQLSAASLVPSTPPFGPVKLKLSMSLPMRDPWIFSLHGEHGSERQEGEVNHLSRMDDYIVIDSGAAVSAAPRTPAANCPLKNGRQLTLRSSTRYTPGHHTMPSLFKRREIVHSSFAIPHRSSTDVGE